MIKTIVEAIHSMLIYVMGNNYTRYGIAHTSFCGLACDFGESAAKYFGFHVNPQFEHFWEHNHQLIVTGCVFLAGMLWYVDKIVEHREHAKVKHHTVVASCTHRRRIRH